jgi:hypothetical protein
MIIGLVGKKGSGKDTIGAYLVKQYGFERKSFADPLKKSVAALFDIPFSDIDKLKLDNKAVISVSMGEVYPREELISTNMSFRRLLQRYGTEAHREIFGHDFWVDQTLPVRGYYHGRAIVVTDCRFTNESDRIKMLDGHIIKVIRPDIVDPQDQHASELELTTIEADHELINNGTIDDLYSAVEELLVTLKPLLYE